MIRDPSSSGTVTQSTKGHREGGARLQPAAKSPKETRRLGLRRRQSLAKGSLEKGEVKEKRARSLFFSLKLPSEQSKSS